MKAKEIADQLHREKAMAKALEKELADSAKEQAKALEKEHADRAKAAAKALKDFFCLMLDSLGLHAV
eukprot:3809151-Karenia_brevis.AAC.1